MKKIFFTLFLVLSASLAQATTWYVDATKSDSNNCTQAQSPSTAKATIGAGLGCIGMGAAAGAGHTVMVADGTYAEVLTNVISYGSSGNVFTLKSSNPLGAIIQPNTTSSNLILQNNGGSMYNVVDGFTINCVNVSANCLQNFRGTDQITYQNNEIKNSKVGDGTGPGSFMASYSEGDGVAFINNDIHDVGNGATQHYNHAIYLEGSNGLIERNTLHKIGGWGVHIYTTHGFNPSNNVVRRNKIYDFAQAGTACGILLSSGTSNKAYSNLVYQTSVNGNAVGICANGTGDSFYNNTVYGTGYQGIDISGSVNAIAKNNITRGADIGANLDSSSGATLIFNNVGFVSTQISQSGATGQTVNNTTNTDPSFTNAGAFDFTIGAGSSAYNAGTDVSGAGVSLDFIGTSRPQGAVYDLGAYEVIVSDGWSSVGTLGSTQSSSADQSTLVLTTTAACTAGTQTCVCYVAVDNNQTTDGDEGAVTITDSASNSWSKAKEFTNGNGTAQTGATVHMSYVKATGTISSGGTITATFTNNTSRDAAAMTCWSFSNSTSNYTLSVPGSATNATDAADPASVTIASLTSAEYLFLHAIASEGPNSDSFTQDANYTSLSANGTTANTGLTATRNPTSDEAESGTWSGGTSTTRWTIVNDYADSSCTSKLTAGTANSEKTFNYSAFSIPTGATNISVAVLYYDGKTSGASSTVRARLKVSGSYFANASTHNPTNGGCTQRTDTWSTNPNTSAAWTVTDINSNLQAFGFGCTDCNPTVTYSSIQLQVTYDNPPDTAMRVRGGFRILTGTGDTIDVASGGSRDHAQVFAALLATAGAGASNVCSMTLTGVGC